MRPVIGMITAPNPKLLHGRHLINTSYVRAVIAAGGYTMLLELLIHTAFGVGGGLQWSWFPMAACFLVGLALIIIAISPGLRESLHKKFFL